MKHLHFTKNNALTLSNKADKKRSHKCDSQGHYAINHNKHKPPGIIQKQCHVHTRGVPCAMLPTRTMLIRKCIFLLYKFTRTITLKLLNCRCRNYHHSTCHFNVSNSHISKVAMVQSCTHTNSYKHINT